MLEYIGIARQKRVVEVNFDSMDFLIDLTNSVCMLIHDGLEYRFSHRSFQEYFAALYLKDQICSPRFARLQIATDERISEHTLFGWSGEPLWHEAILFLHELVSNEPEWAKDLEDWTFGLHQPLTAKDDESAWFRLDLRLAVAVFAAEAAR